MILFTGSEGGVGRVAVPHLRARGHVVRTLDTQNGADVVGDLCDYATVLAAAEGCTTIVHAGAIAHDVAGIAERVLATNAQATWNILLAAVACGATRVVHFSSIQVLGFVGDYHRPVQFPITDDYPRHPMTPYQIGKHLGEEACAAFARRHGLITMSLRPGFITHPSIYAHWDVDGAHEGMHSALWTYVDGEDVAEAIALSLTAPLTGHHAFLLAATDLMPKTPTADLVAEHFADVPWRIPMEQWLQKNPHRSLVDTTAAREKLGWAPEWTWRRRVNGRG
jgi:nucleoside-diphosphate-sugar epimerase